MKIDPLLKRRFDELKQKGDSIWANREIAFTSDEGVTYFQVDTPAFKAWATSALSLLQKVCGVDSIHYRHFDETYRGDHNSKWEATLVGCMAILQAAEEDYKGGYLLSVRGLIQAEVLDSVVEQASELLQSGYKDAACVVAGVALETTLVELCTRNDLNPGKLERMNADLSKAGVYNMGMQKQITAWSERRNRAAHGDWTAYSAADVDDMIRGVTRLIAEYV